MDLWLIGGVIALGVVHGVLPDHGWPIAATYALERPRKLISGSIAALVIGIGHLFSSIVLVIAYYLFSSFAAFAEGPWMGVVAGGLLILLGVYEYYQFHQHKSTSSKPVHQEETDHANHSQQSPISPEATAADEATPHRAEDGAARTSQSAENRHAGHAHDHEHHHDDSGHDHGHQHLTEEHARQGLQSLGVTALVLGFAHEEPIQILAICAGTNACFELMVLYSFAVIVAILIPTLLLIVGYKRHRERIEQYTPYLPLVTALVLVTVGAGFILGSVGI